MQWLLNRKSHVASGHATIKDFVYLPSQFLVLCKLDEIVFISCTSVLGGGYGDGECFLCGVYFSGGWLGLMWKGVGVLGFGVLLFLFGILLFCFRFF